MTNLSKCDRCKTPCAHEDLIATHGHEGYHDVCSNCSKRLNLYPTYYVADGLTFPDYEDSPVVVKDIKRVEWVTVNDEFSIELTTNVGEKITAILLEGTDIDSVVKTYLSKPQFVKIAFK